jgi:hypothetical protein
MIQQQITAKPLNKGKKEKNHQFRNSGITFLVSGVTPLPSSPLYLCLIGKFGALLWQMAGRRVPCGLAEQRPGRAANWPACHVGAWWSGNPASLQDGGLAGLQVRGQVEWQSVGLQSGGLVGLWGRGQWSRYLVGLHLGDLVEQ